MALKKLMKSTTNLINCIGTDPWSVRLKYFAYSMIRLFICPFILSGRSSHPFFCSFVCLIDYSFVGSLVCPSVHWSFIISLLSFFIHTSVTVNATSV